MASDGDNEIVQEFLIESYENLDNLDRELVTLESHPEDAKALGSIFRMIHTIKGTCGFLGFGKLEKVAHVGENLLSRLRDGELRLTPEMTTGLLRTGDAIRKMLASIEATGNEGERNDAELIETLTRLQREETATTANPAQNEEAVAEQQTEPAATTVAVSNQAVAWNGDRSKHDGDLADARVAEDSGKDQVSAQSKTGESSGAAAGKSSASDSTIRVDVVLLDKLMNLVGELVLARNQVLQFSNSIHHNGLLAASQRLNLITTELQEGVMKTRMQPIGNIWTKFPRTVRDVATTCGKQVRIEMVGRETELDKTIIEAIKDPLTHMVRNAVDHGIERPEARRAAGKPEEGKILLRAYHEGGKVNIEISDDGVGLNFDKLRAKAIKRGLISAEQSERMSDREAVNLIFHPGLSTAEQVSNVSGRGVGMDVVKTNIEKIGGSVDVSSVAGAGTTVRMRIPLTLAIIPALIVTSGGDRYAIPQVSLLELVRLKAGQAESKIEQIQGNHFYRLRGRLLALVYLSHELMRKQDGSTESAMQKPVNIVVLQADDRQFGLVVDEINDTEEIVVKPLGKQIKSASTFAGATIMGDGKVALILDVMGLAQRAGVVGQDRERGSAESADAAGKSEKQQTRQTLLLFQEAQGERMAIPLSLVARLEEFPRGAVERAGDQEVVQYRGHILPLLRISDFLGRYRNGGGVRRHGFAEAGSGAAEPNKSENDKLQVVVFRQGEQSIGLIVHRILDIVEQEVALEHPSKEEGIRGSAVVQSKVTDLLDVEEFLQQQSHPAEEELVGSGGRR